MSISCVIGILAATFLSFFPRADSYAQEDVVASVNGHNITLPEFRRRLLEHRGAVFSHFLRQYGVDEHQEEFWTSSFDGNVPLEELRRRALDDCVRIKIQQLLALEKGLVRDISYATFLKELDEENRQRKKAVQNDEVIYGPLEFSESTGFAHSFSLLVSRLKQLLDDDDFEIGEAQLREFYDANKEQFKRLATAKLRGLHASDSDAKEILRRLADQLREGAPVSESMQNKQIGLVYFEQTMGDTTVRDEQSDHFKLPSNVLEVSTGTVHLFEQDSDLFLIETVARREMGYYPFDDKLKRVLHRRYVDRTYEKLIAHRVSEAKVVVNEPVYNRTLTQ